MAVTVRVSPSGSVSLAAGSIVTGLPPGVIAVSSTAEGGSFTAVMVMSMAPMSVPPNAVLASATAASTLFSVSPGTFEPPSASRCSLTNFSVW